MGKGGGEMEGILQLAGGLLMGGYALYKISKEKDVKGFNTDENDGEKKKVEVHHHHHYHHDNKKETVMKVIEEETDDHGYVPEWMSKVEPKVGKDELTLESWKSEETQKKKKQQSSEEEQYVPSWMSQNDSKVLMEELPQESWKSEKKIQQTQQPQMETKSDNSSLYTSESEDDEDYVPSWMSRKDPQTSLDEYTGRRSVVQEKSVSRTLISSNKAISEVVYSLSDVVFVYPNAGKEYFGQDMIQISETNKTNINGECVNVKIMQTRAGAGTAVAGTIKEGFNASVLTSSSALTEMIPTLFDMVEQKLPAVINVAANSIGSDDLVIRQDLSEITSVRETGVILLGSSNAQEAHDFSIVAHIVAHQTKTPVVHFFDGSRGLEQFSKVKTIGSNVLGDFVSKHISSTTTTSNNNQEEELCADKIANIVEQAMKNLGSAVGGTCKPFEYIGDQTAESVIIAMSSVAQVVQDTVGTSKNVGVLKVRMLKPWSASQLLQALPPSVRRVCVLDQSGAKTTPLFQEVVASFHSPAAQRRTTPKPLIIGGRVLPSSQGFTPAFVHAIVSNLVSERPQPNFSVGGEESSLIGSLEHEKFPTPFPSMKQIVVYASSKMTKNVNTATHVIAEQLSQRAGLNVQQLTVQDTYGGDEGVVRSELRMGPDSTKLAESYAIQDANVIVVEQKELGVNTVATIKEGGSVIIVPSSLNNTATTKLSPDVRSALARKHCHVFTIDGSSLFEKLKQDKNEHVVRIGSLWMGIIAALQIAKGVDAFKHVLIHLQNALRISRTFENGPIVNAISSSLQRVDGYLRKSNHSLLSFNTATNSSSIHQPSDLASYLGRDDDIDTYSFVSGHSQSMVLPGVSPIHGNSHTIKQSIFLPRLVVNQEKQTNGKAAILEGEDVEKLSKHKAALNMIFPEAYEHENKARPSEHGVHIVRLIKNERLTPLDYERNIFHLEFDISGTSLKYEIGDALGVYGHNDEQEVDHFIKEYGLNPDEFVAIPSRGKMEKGKTEMVSVRNLLVQHLDLFGRPSKKFYIALAGHATRRYEYLKLMHTGTDDPEAFKLGINETVTFAELLLQYKSANPSIEEIIKMVPAIKARHYSIASSMKLNPRSVHLLIVAVDWVTPLGKIRYGQCTRYLANLDPSKHEVKVSVDVIPSVLRLPPSPKQPLIMAGLGTGLAPFMAFLMERKYQKEMGMEVGPVVLYFGARHRHQEFLYGDLLEQYEREGLVKLRLAFSRDQKQKVYIQHLMQQDAKYLGELLNEENKGYAYLCGPTWPVPTVSNALALGLSTNNNPDFDKLEELKQEGRWLLEVY